MPTRSTMNSGPAFDGPPAAGSDPFRVQVRCLVSWSRRSTSVLKTSPEPSVGPTWWIGLVPPATSQVALSWSPSASVNRPLSRMMSSPTYGVPPHHLHTASGGSVARLVGASGRVLYCTMIFVWAGSYLRQAASLFSMAALMKYADQPVLFSAVRPGWTRFHPIGLLPGQ